MVLRVADPLGFAEGTWRLRVGADGEAVVTRADESEASEVELTVGALSSLLLGGVRSTELAHAGLVRAGADVLVSVDRAFTPEATPLLDIWY